MATLPLATDTFEVEVCYACSAAQFRRALQVAPGTTLEQALALSGVAAAVPGLDLATMQTGIYGKKKPLDTKLRPHDRVEIYRPLIADPKQARRRRKNPAAVADTAAISDTADTADTSATSATSAISSTSVT